jgi:hypothetical protein
MLLIKTDTYGLLDMSYGVESIRIHKSLGWINVQAVTTGMLV